MASNRNITTMAVMSASEITRMFSMMNDMKVCVKQFGFNSKKFDEALKGKTLALVGMPELKSMVVQRAIDSMDGHPVLKKAIGDDVCKALDCIDSQVLWTSSVDLVCLSAKECDSCQSLVQKAYCPFVNFGGPMASPVQVINDLYTILEGLGSLKETVIAVVGDCANGITGDLIRGSKMGYKVRCVCPASCKPSDELVNEFKPTVTDNIAEGIKGADVVYTCAWNEYRNIDEKIMDELKAFKVTMELLKLAKPSVMFMNPQPHTAIEQDAEVLNCGRSFVKHQAENLVLAAKAVILDALKITVRSAAPKRILVALGGNALLQPGQKGTAELQFENAKQCCGQLAELVERGYQLLVTHGNGPQVGAIFLQNDIARAQVPDFPLYVCGAESQGFIGFMMAQEMRQALLERHVKDIPVSCIVTQTVVSKNDPAFQNPSKPIGRFYTKDEAEELQKKGWTMMEDSGRGFRYIVPSPQPLEIVEWQSIRALMEAGNIVVSCGGGGIPVLKDEKGSLQGVASVIDKDLCGALLAKVTGVDHYCILTDVDAVFLDYKKPTQRSVSSMTVKEAREYLAAGQFGKGSMGPKVEALCRFTEQSGRAAIVTSLNKCVEALDGKAGTWILP